SNSSRKAAASSALPGRTGSPAAGARRGVPSQARTYSLKLTSQISARLRPRMRAGIGVGTVGLDIAGAKLREEGPGDGDARAGADQGTGGRPRRARHAAASWPHISAGASSEGGCRRYVSTGLAASVG